MTLFLGVKNRVDLIRRERGDVNLIALAIGLPLFFLFAFIAFDFLRIPMARRAVRDALAHASMQLVSEWNCNGDADDDPHCLYNTFNGLVAPDYGGDPSPPAAHNICDETIPGQPGTCDYSSLTDPSAYLSTVKAKALTVKASLLAARYLEEYGSGLLNFKGDFALSFATVINRADFSGIVVPGLGLRYKHSFYPGGSLCNDEDEFNAMAALNPSTVGENVRDLYRSFEQVAFDSASPLGWTFFEKLPLNDAGEVLGGGPGVESTNWFGSGWLIGIIYAKVRSPIGQFSFISGNVSSDPGVYLISEYIIVPLERVATIETGV